MNLNNGFRQITKGRDSGNIKADRSPKASIDPGNAFSINLPVISRTLVNQQVNVEYYVLEREAEAFEDVTISHRDCEFIEGTNKVRAVVKLSKVYSRIESVRIEWNPLVTLLGISDTTAHSLIIEALVTSNDFEEFRVFINS